MDFCVDDGTGNGRLNSDSDEFEFWCKSHDFRLFDKMPARIGDKLGGGKIFKWFGVNERRLPSDAVYGDRNADDGIGDNGNNGEFGVWTLVYSDIFFSSSFFFFNFFFTKWTFKLNLFYRLFIYKFDYGLNFTNNRLVSRRRKKMNCSTIQCNNYNNLLD